MKFAARIRQHAQTIIMMCGWDCDELHCQCLVNWVNGPWWEVDAIKVYVLPLEDAGLLSSRDASDEEIIQGVTRALLTTMFASSPIAPIKARWTRVYGSLQFFMPGFAVHNILGMVYAATFDGVGLGRVVPAPAVVAGAEPQDAASGYDPFVPQHENQEACERALDERDDSREQHRREQNSRKMRGASFFRHSETVFSTVALTLYAGVVNYLTAWLLKQMGLRAMHPLCGGPHVILDITWPPVSPVHLCLQHLSSFLMRPIQETRISTCAKYGPLTAGRIRQLHRFTLAAASGLKLRFEDALNKSQFRMMQLEDVRRTDHHCIEAEIMGFKFCCCDVNFAGTFLLLMIATCGQRSVAFIRSKFAKTLRGATIRAIDGCCDDLETRHKRNRGSGSDSIVAVETLSCVNCLREVQCIQEAYCGPGSACDLPIEEGSLEEALVATSGARAKAAKGRGSGARVSWSGIGLFHADRCRRARIRACTADAWRVSHYEWARLYSEEQSHWEEFADLANNHGLKYDSIVGSDAPLAIADVSEAGDHLIRASDCWMLESQDEVPSAFGQNSTFAKLQLPMSAGGRPIAVADLTQRSQRSALSVWQNLFESGKVTASNNAATLEALEDSGDSAVAEAEPIEDIHPPHGSDADLFADVAAPDAAGISVPEVAVAGLEAAAPGPGVPVPGPEAAPRRRRKQREEYDHDPSHPRCQDIGACWRDYVDAGVPFGRFVRLCSQTWSFLRTCTGRKPLTTVNLCGRLIQYKGFTSGAEAPSTFCYFWLGFSNGSPIFQMWLAMRVQDGVDPGVLPLTLLPRCDEYVASSLQARSGFPSDCGKLMFRKSQLWLDDMARKNPMVVRWQMVELDYEPACLTDPSLPFGMLRVSGARPDTQTEVVLKGKVQAVAPASPSGRTDPGDIFEPSSDEEGSDMGLEDHMFSEAVGFGCEGDNDQPDDDSQDALWGDDDPFKSFR